MLATVVTIVTLASGGPVAPVAYRRTSPERLTDTTIKVFQDIGPERRPYAERYEGGKLTLRLRPGRYSIEATLHTTSALEHPVPCDLASTEPIVTFQVSHDQPRQLKLWCSIK